MADQLALSTGETDSAAVFSACGTYRYDLVRWWGTGRLVTFVMLNPSTADATRNDPTVVRCIGYARAWGAAGLRVVNVYALRSTDPSGLWRTDDPVGPDNDRHLAAAAAYAADHDALIIAAWGAHARPDRVAAVLALPGMDRLHALGTTKDGHPRHPLYLPAIATPTPWPTPTGDQQ